LGQDARRGARAAACSLVAEARSRASGPRRVWSVRSTSVPPPERRPTRRRKERPCPRSFSGRAS
jgi:hypothetical protein